MENWRHRVLQCGPRLRKGTPHLTDRLSTVPCSTRPANKLFRINVHYITTCMYQKLVKRDTITKEEALAGIKSLTLCSLCSYTIYCHCKITVTITAVHSSGGQAVQSGGLSWSTCLAYEFGYHCMML